MITSLWNEVRAKRLLHEVDRRNFPGEPLLAATQDQGVVPRDSLDYRVWNPTKDLENYKLVMPGDFVISLRSFQGGIELSRHRGIVSPAYTVMALDKSQNAEFFKYLLKSSSLVRQLDALGSGIRQGKSISYQAFGRLFLSVPPPDLQAPIADFLDRETTRIDELIEAKRRLRALLWERIGALRDALLEDPDAVPTRVRHLISRITSGSRGWATHYADTGAPFLRIGNVQRGVIDLRLDDLVLVDAPNTAESRRTMVKSGDVVVSITADVGSVGVVDERVSLPAYVSQHLALLVPNEQTSGRWLAHALSSNAAQAQFDAARYGGTKTQLGLEDVLNIRVPAPSVGRQWHLVAELDNQIATHNAALDALDQQLRLLEERRQALITAAVTGQLDITEDGAYEELEKATA